MAVIALSNIIQPATFGRQWSVRRIFRHLLGRLPRGWFQIDLMLDRILEIKTTGREIEDGTSVISRCGRHEPKQLKKIAL